MKILHVSTTDSGGAGLCCIRIHSGLLQAGIDSKVLVLRKNHSDPGVYVYEKQWQKIPKLFRWTIGFTKLIFQKFRIPLSKRQYLRYKLDRLRSVNETFYSLPFSDYDITEHPLVSECDIIHLHWVAGFLDYPSFFHVISKPVIWTLHDEYLYLGGFHYSDEMNGSLSSFKTLEEQLRMMKKQNIARCKNLSIVSLSKKMLEISMQNDIVRDRPHYIINNPVDSSIFKPLNKRFCREVLNLPENKKIVLFISFYLNDKRKGFPELVKAVSELNNQEIAICATGEPDISLNTDPEIFYTGQISDQRFMPMIYSACDLFVMPSYREAFAQTPLEALACGIPVVAFPCSGTEELINEKNGIRTAGFTVSSLKEGMLKALGTAYDADWIREDVVERFSPDVIAAKYINVYKEKININS